MRKSSSFFVACAALIAGAWLLAGQSPEDPAPDDRTIAQFAAGAVAELAKAYPEAERKFTPRDAHPKAHGCVKGVFQVAPDLPEDLRIATFSQPGQRYKAWLRSSNGAFTPGPDRNPDFRGMAIKLIDADPERADPARRRPPHDILLVNYPRFFLADFGDIRALMRAGAFVADGERLQPYFFPGANPFGWRLRALAIAIANATRDISSPLRADYFSMTPYGLDPGRAVKYAARPCAPPPAPAVAPTKDDPDFLRAALRRELKAAPACFELFAQLRNADSPPDTLPLDDARREWPEAQAPFRRLGRLELPMQDAAAEGLDAFCENLDFNPGHAPEALAPLGGINRARMTIYATIVAYRRSRNGVTPPDAGQAWDHF